MYYLLNLMSWVFTIVAIALMYNKTASSGVVVTLLISAVWFQMVASIYIVSVQNDFNERIKKLENKKPENKEE